MREFEDADGVTWKVWSTMPMPQAVAISFRAGWLTFQSATARRRLSPIPEDWETAIDARLCEYCDGAQPAQTPITGTRPVEPRPESTR